MKIKAKTGYMVAFWSFTVITTVCYIWTIYSFVRWILKLILL